MSLNQFMLFMLVFTFGCAVGLGGGELRFQDRELLVHPDKPALAFPHKVTLCTKRPWALRWLGKKCHKEQEIDVYDLNDENVRKRLIDAAFTCKSKARFIY